MIGKWKKKIWKNHGNSYQKLGKPNNHDGNMEEKCGKKWGKWNHCGNDENWNNTTLWKIAEKPCSVIWLHWRTTGAVAASEHPPCLEPRKPQGSGRCTGVPVAFFALEETKFLAMLSCSRSLNTQFGGRFLHNRPFSQAEHRQRAVEAEDLLTTVRKGQTCLSCGEPSHDRFGR